MVEVANSTPEPDGSRKTYFLRVPPTMQTCARGRGVDLRSPFGASTTRGGELDRSASAAATGAASTARTRPTSGGQRTGRSARAADTWARGTPRTGKPMTRAAGSPRCDDLDHDDCPICLWDGEAGSSVLAANLTNRPARLPRWNRPNPEEPIENRLARFSQLAREHLQSTDRTDRDRVTAAFRDYLGGDALPIEFVASPLALSDAISEAHEPLWERMEAARPKKYDEPPLRELALEERPAGRSRFGGTDGHDGASEACRFSAHRTTSRTMPGSKRWRTLSPACWVVG